ncbi:fimbrial protein [Pseudomonas sp. LB3P31]
MQQQKYLPALLQSMAAICLCTLLCQQANASCAKNTYDTTHPTLNFGSMTIPRDRGTPSVIATQYITIDEAKCTVTGGSAGSFTYAMNGTVSAYPNIYPTNVSGVGVRVTPAYNQGNELPAPYVSTPTNLVTNPYIFPQNQLKVELIKIGPIASGTALSGQFYTGIASASGFGSDATFIGGIFQTVSCSTQSSTVILPPGSLNDFQSSQAARTTGFSINIDCLGANMDGLNAIDYTINNRTAVLDAKNGVIALKPESTSLGIGIQITDGNGLPINFQTAYNLAGFSKLQTMYTIPLNASYYKVGAIRPGTVESFIDFTITYR